MWSCWAAIDRSDRPIGPIGRIPALLSDFAFELIGERLELVLGEPECFGVVAENVFGGAFDAAPQAESLLKTVNGDITVTLPGDLAAELRIKTMRGGVYTDFETVEQPTEREPSRRPGEPRFVYRRRGFTGYRVGKGGPELTFETLNGDVRIQRAPR